MDDWSLGAELPRHAFLRFAGGWSAFTVNDPLGGHSFTREDPILDA